MLEAIIVIFVIFWLLSGLWKIFVTMPLQEKARAEKEAADEKTLHDYYASLDQMTIEDHRAKLAEVEAELKADIVRFMEDCQRNNRAISSHFVLTELKYSYGTKSLFTFLPENRYLSHLIRIIRQETGCEEPIARCSAREVLEKKAEEWVKVFIDRRNLEKAKQYAEYALKQRQANLVARKYL